MKKNVLLVEDDPALRMVVREVLKGDFNIDEADNGEDGINKGLNSNADLVILDYHLPKRDGLEVIAAIKKAHPDIPVIVLTGYLNPESEKQFNRLGANKIFPKPFNYRALLETVKDLSGDHSAQIPQASEPAVAPTKIQSIEPSQSDAPILTTSLNALAALAEKIEFLQTITEKQWIENHDLSAIRETTRIMEAEVRKFYGQVNQSLIESDALMSPAIQAANKPSLLGDN
ncbi:MAG: DNA-binding response OmpR family regulator [Candidatus Pelagisphaera sp.]|jgi:DNA-binding response OmpR family regulator